MDFALDANQESIRDAIEKICARFDDAYWLKKDKEGGFPIDFHKAMPTPAGSASVSPRNMAARAWGSPRPRS